MTDQHRTPTQTQWTSVQAYTLSVICLLVGIAGGWLIRGSQASAASAPAESAAASAGMAGQSNPAQMKQMADTQAAPLLEKLKSDADNPSLLAEIGNVYYDAQQYPAAIDYYGRALKLAPSNASVRTDMGTAMWYLGDSDGAITQFNQALQFEPNKANALFNLGIVKWQGKMDVEGAVAAWQKLLTANPNYEAKEKVEQLIAQARKHANVKPGTQAKPLPQS